MREQLSNMKVREEEVRTNADGACGRIRKMKNWNAASPDGVRGC